MPEIGEIKRANEIGIISGKGLTNPNRGYYGGQDDRVRAIYGKG